MRPWIVWLFVFVASASAGSAGRVAIDMARWDAMHTKQKETFVLESVADVWRAGYDGRVTVWSEDGSRVLATYEPGQSVKILRGWSPSNHGTVTAIDRVRNGPPEAAIVYLILILGFAIFSFLIWVAIVRWIFRVNRIVAKQEETCELLNKIVARLEGKSPSDRSPA
jgi:hypothetical protein